ncbi:MAG: site-specific integrase [Phycisphaerales bacterium]
MHVYTAQVVGELLNACNSRIWYARILCAKTTAMRRGEILNLHLDDVDFKNDIIYVQPKENAKDTWHFEPKDNELRELPLVSDLKELLLELKACLPKEQPYYMIPADRYARVIEMKRRGILKDRLETCPDENWRQPFERIKDRADVVKGTFHDLRRTCITEWLESGLKPHEVMRLAGHSDIETTMTYYAAIRRELTDKARAASKKCLVAAA